MKLNKILSLSKKINSTKCVYIRITSKGTKAKSPQSLIMIFNQCTELKKEKTKMTRPKLVAHCQSIVNCITL